MPPQHKIWVKGSPLAPALLTPQERTGILCTGGWVGLGAGLDGYEKTSPPFGFCLRIV